jgi:hypothetical protein
LSDDDIELDYQYLANRALRGVVREVLSITEELGAAPGEHHFYIEFLTQGDGVAIPDHLVETYPERMTIVLQHQFKDLSVNEDGFQVTLWFKGQPAPLTIPYDAVTSFADPSVNFGLRFDEAMMAPLGSETDDDEEDAGDASDTADDETVEKIETKSKSKPAKGDKDKSDDKSADVVSLDAFRKK